MSRRVVVAGASGFLGTAIVTAYRGRGDDVTTVGRGSGSDVRWGDAEGLLAALDGADVLVNLAGRSVNCRYGPENRRVILASRVETTRELAHAIRDSERPVPLWMNASTATIYRHAEDRPQTESTGELGSGFSVGIARAWEEALGEADLPGTRRVALRIAIVLGHGSVLTPLARMARLGLGGAHLDGPWFRSKRRIAAGTLHEAGARGGRQRFSWIHVDDVVAALHFLEEHPELDGPVNLAAPNPVDDRTMMATLRRVLGVPVGMPVPRWLLEPGSWLIRTETELVLKSRWVVPERLLAAGFTFRYPELEPALRDLLASEAPVR